MLRTIICALFFAAFASGVSATEGADQTCTYDVEGMTCALCGKAIERSLRGVEGVKSISVDQDGGRITIVASAKVESESLERAIESAGSYTATRVKVSDD